MKNVFGTTVICNKINSITVTLNLVRPTYFDSDNLIFVESISEVPCRTKFPSTRRNFVSFSIVCPTFVLTHPTKTLSDKICVTKSNCHQSCPTNFSPMMYLILTTLLVHWFMYQRLADFIHQLQMKLVMFCDSLTSISSIYFHWRLLTLTFKCVPGSGEECQSNVCAPRSCLLIGLDQVSVL